MNTHFWGERWKCGIAYRHEHQLTGLLNLCLGFIRANQARRIHLRINLRVPLPERPITGSSQTKTNRDGPEVLSPQ